MEGEAPRELLVWLQAKRDLIVPPLDAGYEYGLETAPLRIEPTAHEEEGRLEALAAAS